VGTHDDCAPCVGCGHARVLGSRGRGDDDCAPCVGCGYARVLYEGEVATPSAQDVAREARPAGAHVCVAQCEGEQHHLAEAGSDALSVGPIWAVGWHGTMRFRSWRWGGTEPHCSHRLHNVGDSAGEGGTEQPKVQRVDDQAEEEGDDDGLGQQRRKHDGARLHTRRE
jgi:hypothetical protein